MIKKSTGLIFIFLMLLLLPAVFADDYDTLSGQPTSLENIESLDKAILLFWTTWCPYCRSAVEEFADICGQVSSKGYNTYFINIGEEKEKVSRFAEKAAIDCPVVFDYESRLADYYRILGIPTYVFLDSGKVVDRSNSISIPYVEELYGEE